MFVHSFVRPFVCPPGPLRPEIFPLRPEACFLRPSYLNLVIPTFQFSNQLSQASNLASQASFQPSTFTATGFKLAISGQTDGRTNKSPPVFYRTSSPSGPLPKNRPQMPKKLIITDGRTNRQTDRLTVIASYRDAYTQLKNKS